MYTNHDEIFDSAALEIYAKADHIVKITGNHFKGKEPEFVFNLYICDIGYINRAKK